VYGAIVGCSRHICAEHILKGVVCAARRLRMNKTTVYRALDLLLESGLVIEHRGADGRAQYEPASRGRHSHLLCRRCGSCRTWIGGRRARAGLTPDTVFTPTWKLPLLGGVRLLPGLMPSCAPEMQPSCNNVAPRWICEAGCDHAYTDGTLAGYRCRGLWRRDAFLVLRESQGQADAC